MTWPRELISRRHTIADGDGAFEVGSVGRVRGGSLAAGIRPAEARDIVALCALHARKPLRIERSLADMALLLSIPRMRVLVLERRGAAVANACFGKATDFPDWWHER